MAIKDIAEQRDDVRFVYPVHLNPAVKDPVNSILGHTPRVSLIPPLGYRDLVKTMDESYLVITDSGGIQEEAPSLGKSVLITREVTERPEGVEAGAAILVGFDRQTIARSVNRLLDDPDEYLRMSQVRNPYGDGSAGRQISSIVVNWLRDRKTSH